MIGASLPGMLLTESEDGSSDANAKVRAEERLRDETQNSGENEETQDAGAERGWYGAPNPQGASWSKFTEKSVA
jgi:hypothetical protein